jgi:hypothetical protein
VVDDLANLSGEVFMEYCGYARVFDKRNVGSDIVFEKMRKDDVNEFDGRWISRCGSEMEDDMVVVS